MKPDSNQREWGRGVTGERMGRVIKKHYKGPVHKDNRVVEY